MNFVPMMAAFVVESYTTESLQFHHKFFGVKLGQYGSAELL